MELCGHFTGAANTGQRIVIWYPYNTVGRYVQVQIVSGRGSVMSPAESSCGECMWTKGKIKVFHSLVQSCCLSISFKELSSVLVLHVVMQFDTVCGVVWDGLCGNFNEEVDWLSWVFFPFKKGLGFIVCIQPPSVIFWTAQTFHHIKIFEEHKCLARHLYPVS